MKRIFIFLGMWGALLATAVAQPQEDASGTLSSWEKARAAAQNGKGQEAEVWLAKYLGESYVQGNVDSQKDEINHLVLGYRGALSFDLGNSVPAEWINWLKEKGYRQWINEHQLDLEHGEFELVRSADGEGFSGILASPQVAEIRGGQDGQTFLLALLTAQPQPYILSGRINKARLEYYHKCPLETDGKPLLFVWPPQFKDVDGDGVNEVWTKYLVLDSGNFASDLAVYRFKREDKTLQLVQKFSAHNNGMLMLTADNGVETAEGTSSGHHLQEWQYHDGIFTAVNERTVPSLWGSDDWKKYFED